MRVFLASLAAVGGVGLAAAGLVFVPIGVLEQRSAGDMYEVAFQQVGDECSGGHELYLDIENGTPLDCVPSYVIGGSPRVDLPGFTEAQNDEVARLGRQLGSEGLTDAEQHRIQNRIDEIAAAIPDADRPLPDSATVWPADAGVWGARRAWLGGGMIAVGILGIIYAMRAAR
ncbi:hypothetical protein [Streptomyces blattellae]|uniref:hypothetical protein n=1 Tax=Streptomyces blattellae TaxID=2569855 RepID=UPI0012B96CA2|nr:hypothetical protein [Streptomyces blattellae]